MRNNIDRTKKGYVILQIIKTSFFVFIGEMFFRADTVSQGFGMLSRMFTRLFVLKSNEISRFGLDFKDLLAIIIGLIFVFIIGILKEKKKNVREEVASKHIVIRWLLYYLE